MYRQPMPNAANATSVSSMAVFRTLACSEFLFLERRSQLAAPAVPCATCRVGETRESELRAIALGLGRRRALHHPRVRAYDHQSLAAQHDFPGQLVTCTFERLAVFAR